LSIVNIEIGFDLKTEYTLPEIAQIVGCTIRNLQYEVKKDRLKYLYIEPPRHGGTIVAGYQVLDWIFKTKCNGLMKRKE